MQMVISGYQGDLCESALIFSKILMFKAKLNFRVLVPKAKCSSKE